MSGEKRSVRKMLALADLCGSDWSTRMLRERTELEEFAEREQQVREARRRAEQQRVATTNANWWAALDQHIAEIAQRDNLTQDLAIEQVVGETRQQLRDEFADQVREVKAMIGALERRLDALSQGKREKFEFARGRGDACQ